MITINLVFTISKTTTVRIKIDPTGSKKDAAQ